jgi:uncharacterized membrane protein HdeD (DUF308 family)
MSTQAGPPEPTEQGTAPMDRTRLPAIARYWWLTALRGLVALALAIAVGVAGRSSARLVTFLALFWMTGGLITLRFALAIRPRPGFRLGLAAATAAVVGAVLVLLRDRLSGLIDPEVFVGLLGISAVLTGVLRILGGFAAEERLGTPLDPRRDRARHVGARARWPAAADERGRPRPAGADCGRLGCGQRLAAPGRGAAAAPLRPQLADIGRVAPGSVAGRLATPLAAGVGLAESVRARPSREGGRHTYVAMRVGRPWRVDNELGREAGRRTCDRRTASQLASFSACKVSTFEFPGMSRP